LAEAIRYALNRWTDPVRFVDDGRIDLDTNPVERAIRPAALGRKNALFADSEDGPDRWAIMASLIETAKLNGIEPFAWPRDVRDAHGRRLSRRRDRSATADYGLAARLELGGERSGRFRTPRRCILPLGQLYVTATVSSFRRTE